MNIQELLSQLPEFFYGQALSRKRIVVVSESIHSTTAKRIIQELLALEIQDPAAPIWMFLNSPGGEVSSGFGIFDIIRFIKPEVKILVSGLAASIATVILLGAKKQDRYSLPNSRFLIHQPLIGENVQGQASDLEITANEILKTRDKIKNLYHDETHQPLERIAHDIERDYWMTAPEAKEYGLIDKIIDSWP